MQLHNLSRINENKKARRVGRGGKRGKTSGKGGKGQTARAGSRIRPEIRDMIKKLPKLRGHGVNRAKGVNNEVKRAIAINLDTLEKNFAAGDSVSPLSLLKKGMVPRTKGKLPLIKILGRGTLTKKLQIANCAVSATAKEAITKVGGTILS